MQVNQAVSSNHADWRTRESARAAVCEDFDRHLDNLRACVHWLIAQGVSIIDADLRRGRFKPRITVVASPLLHVLFKDDAATVQRRACGDETLYTWAAVRYECEIRWEAAQ